MKLKCPWCRQIYDTKTESSVWCQQNPRRGHKKRKPRIVRIGVLSMNKSPWAAIAKANS